MRTKTRSTAIIISMVAIIAAILCAAIVIYQYCNRSEPILPTQAHAIYTRPNWAARDRDVELISYDASAVIRDSGITYEIPPQDLTAWHDFESNVEIIWHFQIKLANDNIIEGACGEPVASDKNPDVSILETGQERYYVANENLTLIPFV